MMPSKSSLKRISTKIGALTRDFASAGARVVPHSQPMFFDFAEATEDFDAFADALERFLAERACCDFESMFVGGDHQV